MGRTPWIDGPNNLLGDDGSGLRDATGALVPDSQPFYYAVQGQENGIRFGVTLPNPNYKPGGTSHPAQPAPAPTPPHLQFTFDTIGQIIARSIGHCRLPLKLIWVLGIDASGAPVDISTTTSDTPAGSTVIDCNFIPAWAIAGIGISAAGIDGSEGVASGTTVVSISGGSVALSTPTINDIPAFTVINFASGIAAATIDDAAVGTTILTFASGDVPAFAQTLSGIYAVGAGIPPNATVVSASDSLVGLSAPLLAVVPAGTDVTFTRSKAAVTFSFAAALCAPIDPNEEGDIVAFLSGDTLLQAAPGLQVGGGTTLAESGASPTDIAQVGASLSAITFYPGTEAQMPDPQIVSDKGAAVTNAFRGLRYIVVPSWPASGGVPSNLSAIYRRSNPITSPDVNAVEFGRGAS